MSLNMPTGINLVYKLNAALKPPKHLYLGDPEAVRVAIEKVAGQGKKKTGWESSFTCSRLDGLLPHTP